MSNDKVAATFHGQDPVDLAAALRAAVDRAREARKAPRPVEELVGVLADPDWNTGDDKPTTFRDADLPIKTPVTYWPGVREGAGIESHTRSSVWNVCGQPVVMVEGYSGGIALTHIERRVEPEEKPDLTPEQDLRAAVADMLANAVHFGECKANADCDCDYCRCTCLIGRLNWAINAEQVPA